LLLRVAKVILRFKNRIEKDSSNLGKPDSLGDLYEKEKY